LDDDYWQALLTQPEEAMDDVTSAEDGDWEGLEHFKKTLFFDYSHAYSQPSDWEAAKQVHQHDQTIQLEVIGFNKGGLLVEWNTLRGFVPCSQLVEQPAAELLGQPSQVMERYIGQKLAVRVIELNQAHNRLILSERAAQVQPGTRQHLLEHLLPDTLSQGIVTNICHFGVFVDLGGVEGLIHISEMSWGRVEHPRDMVQRGQSLQVYIMEVDPPNGRVALSLKRLQSDPWLAVEQRYQVGQQLEGVITTVIDFGAFVELESGLEGLIHISELAHGHFLHPHNVVREGQRVCVEILNILPGQRRIGLSLRQHLS
jgi:small subunit ribosomal protein S1